MLSVSRFSLSTLAAFKDVMKLLMAMLAFVICSTAAHAQVFTNIKTINGIYSADSSTKCNKDELVIGG